MTFIIDIHIDEDHKRTYRVEAKDETEAKARLALRLSPSQRELLTIDSIQIDPATVSIDEPYGTLAGNNWNHSCIYKSTT